MNTTYDSWVNGWFDSINDVHDNDLNFWMFASYLQEINDEDLDDEHIVGQCLRNYPESR